MVRDFKREYSQTTAVTNFAARILANIKNFDHISPVLNGLGWLTTDELA